MRMKVLNIFFILTILLTGCSSSKITFIGDDRNEDFKNPQFIIVNQYSRLLQQSNTRFITGTEMETLIQEIRASENHPAKKGAYSCPNLSISASNPAWEYDLVLHFDRDQTLTFSLPYSGCNFLYDERDDRFFNSRITNIKQYF